MTSESDPMYPVELLRRIEAAEATITQLRTSLLHITNELEKARQDRETLRAEKDLSDRILVSLCQDENIKRIYENYRILVLGKEPT